MADAKAYAQRNQQGSDWFSHDAKATVPSPPVHLTQSPKKEVISEQDSGRAQIIKPKCDSNQWFKYDGSDHSATAHVSPVKTESVASVKKDENVAPASKGQREGDVYSRRDKMGTSASWFHGEGETATGAATRVVSKEGGNNASRMRGESGNWFSHDSSNTDSNKELHVAKGRTNRPQNDEMNHIFNMGK